MIAHTQTVDQAPLRHHVQPCLVVLSGAQKGYAFWLDGQRARVGRAEDCEVRLDDASVSRYHAELVKGNESWLMTDLDSKNGSFLSDRAITVTSALRDGDLCRFGSVVLQFFMVQSIQALNTSPLTVAGLALDEMRMAVLLHDQSASLTETEFRMLAALMRRPGRALSALALMRAAYPRTHVVAQATVASHLRNLRKKLMDLNQGVDLIKSYYGRGYALQIESQAARSAVDSNESQAARSAVDNDESS
jgi:pSer/pThr/pTyr-binding forkhead associated (FHA) protein